MRAFLTRVSVLRRQTRIVELQTRVERLVALVSELREALAHTTTEAKAAAQARKTADAVTLQVRCRPYMKPGMGVAVPIIT